MLHLEWSEESKVRPRNRLCTVLTAGLEDCRWVTDKKSPRGFAIFCGKPTVSIKKPYCKDHYPLIYVKPPEKKK